MKNFTSILDVPDPEGLVKKALVHKQNPYGNKQLGQNKTLGLIFLNPSLRTRLSTQKAAMNLGMQVMVMNIDKEGWALEMEDGAIMNGTTVEHIKDAAAVIGQYCDVIGLRSFPGLKNKEDDYSEKIFKKFQQYCAVPMVSLESATLHPLQSLADLITITELKQSNKRPKVVLTWAPHVKALPQAVPNSFAQWMCAANVDFTITHPIGLELAEEFTKGATITHNQEEALKDADFIYVKNWSRYTEYAQAYVGGEEWLLNEAKLSNCGMGKIMHCLPVRRNVELKDELIDSPRSLILKQADNRLWAAQAVLTEILNKIN